MNLAAPSRQLDAFLRLRDVRSITGLGKTTIYRHIEEGSFPRPYRLGGRAVGWKRSEIENWVENRVRHDA